MSDHLKQDADMQKMFYHETRAAVAEIAGNADCHENVPYATHLPHLPQRYGDIRKPVPADPAHARANGRPRVLPGTHPNPHGPDDAWFTHMAFFHLREPRK